MFGRPSKAERDHAFSVFMEQSSASLMRTAWLLTGNRDQASELVQAALVKTYAAWSRVREDQALAYARRVLINQRTDTWRATRGETAYPQVPERADLDAGGGAGVEHRDEIVRLLRTLPEQQRKVVILRYYQDLSEQAVADLLGISVGSVKSAASRGLASLRTHLATTSGGTQ